MSSLKNLTILYDFPKQSVKLNIYNTFFEEDEQKQYGSELI